MNINLSKKKKKGNQVNSTYLLSFDDVIKQFKIQNKVSFGSILLHYGKYEYTF